MTVLGLVAAIAIVWVGQDDGPGELVAESAAAVAGWGGISYRGGVADEDGITTVVQLTVTADGAAQGTLAREFGAEAEVAADAGGILLRGNREWWLTDHPNRAEVLAGLWVDNPPAEVAGLPSGLPPSPSALAHELSRPGAEPWTEIGRETVNGREGLLLSDGIRRVVVSIEAPRRLLSVSLPRRGPPQVAPRAFIAQPSEPDPDEPQPPDESAPSAPPQYVENFTIDEPTGDDLIAAATAAAAIRAANPGKPAPRPLGELLQQDAGFDAETVELVNRLAERGFDARAALPVPPPYGKALLQVLDAITADVKPNDPKRGGEFLQVAKGIEKAIASRQFAAVHEAATDGNLGNPAELRNFLQHIHNTDAQVHLQAVARLAAAGNKLRIEVPYEVDGISSSVDWVVDAPAAAGSPPINTEHKRITGNDRRVYGNTRDAAAQLARFVRSGQAQPGSMNHIELHIPSNAGTDLGRRGAEALKDGLRQLNLYQACVDGGGGSCSVDLITVTTEGTFEGRPIVIPHEFRPQELRRGDPPPGGPAGRPNGPPPSPEPDSAARAPGPTSLFAGQEHTVEGQGALQDAATQRAASALGGIDFSSLELRYLAERDAEDGRSMRYAFAADPLTDAPPAGAAGGLDAAQQASDAFFVWLALPTSAFTVNLNPDEPERIVDPGLGRTDAGRILLEADLQLKKTVAALIHPESPLGARYWDAISRAGEQTCQSFRQWIVPAPAEVWDNGEEMYILDAPLQVKMETEYLQTRGAGSASACPQQPRAVEEQNENAFRTMILPEVERAVNEAPEYADLRHVYLSRVAAEWYRQRSLAERMSFTHLIDTGDVTSWPAREAWSPREVFDRYVESYTQGEFNVTRETRTGDWVETRTYVYGGVDWTQVSLQQPSREQLQARWPDLAGTVGDSFAGPAPDRHGRIWLSSASSVPSPVDEHGAGLSMYLAIGAILIGVGFGVRSWWRVRRANRTWLATHAPPRR